MIELRDSSDRNLFIPIVNLSPHPQTTRYIHYPEKLRIRNCLSIFHHTVYWSKLNSGSQLRN